MAVSCCHQKRLQADQIRSDQIRSDQIRSDQIRPERHSEVNRVGMQSVGIEVHHRGAGQLLILLHATNSVHEGDSY